MPGSTRLGVFHLFAAALLMTSSASGQAFEDPMQPQAGDPEVDWLAADTDEQADYQPGDLGQTFVEIDGEIYGAQPNEMGPIGGKDGYAEIFTDGDYTAHTLDELLAALEKAQPGERVFIPGDVILDPSVRLVTQKFVLSVPEGVTVASDRGHDGSEGAMIRSDVLRTVPLFEIQGPDVRITGLRLRGPDHWSRAGEVRRYVQELDGDFYDWPVSLCIRSKGHDRLEVDNCEISGWSYAGVELRDSHDAHIHHSSFHHNQRHGLGYGVTHRASTSLIERCMFNRNRHAIAGYGSKNEGYEAAHNVILPWAPVHGHQFDMHGGRDREDGTTQAGDFLKIHHNQVRIIHRKAAYIRGVPREEAVIHNNWFFYPEPGGDVVTSDGNTRVFDNVYGVDPQRKPEEPGFEPRFKQ